MHKFRSRIDWWVLGFFICLTGMLVQLLLTMYAKGTMVQYPVHTAVYVLAAVVVWWPVLNTRYVISDGILTIHCMWLTWKIPVADIQSITATTNSVSSPALSLDRLEVVYLKNGKSCTVLVSPKNKELFSKSLMLKD
ncbi:hypothetical protein CDG60_02370 [Acinetobacter chinensis]|uniref:PH domain-containing protein n=1 Tax=Acinetobacter chinensis TaxID=2004650 RepID=A0A3B7LT03_9GAMM|nr:PH domain-containing protein [Acinetobacter chinensis]AXY55541.1 hypothetical protein CDG60_02370 [Acinetobacter chinensis]MDV2469570.1 PH domain-containing protein [Acinetobacter chinensis]